MYVDFIVDETGSELVFSGVSPIFLYHKFNSTISTLISFISFHFIQSCDGETGVVGRHPSYSLISIYRGYIASLPSIRSYVGHELRLIFKESFFNLSVTSPTSQLILQPFRFTYVIALSPTLPLFHLRHSSFSNPSLASPTS